MYVAVALSVSLLMIPCSAEGFEKPSPVPERNRQTRPHLSDRPDGKPIARKPASGPKATGTADRTTVSKPAPGETARLEQQPASDRAEETGLAGFMAAAAPGARTATGELLDNNEMIAAHARYALGSRVRVTNQANGRSVVVRINDRCKADTKRVINVSRRAAEELGFINAGTARVRIEWLDAKDVAGQKTIPNRAP